MRSETTFCRKAGVIMLCLSFAGCLSAGRRPEVKPAEPEPSPNATHLSEAVSEFGDLLQAYPPRRPYPFEAPVVIDVGTILNYSGEEGLPGDFATVLTTILSDIGEAVAPKSPKTLGERQSDPLDHFPRTGPPADLTIRGSITEGEKWLSTEFSAEMDILFGGSGRGSSRKSVDSGISRGREQEVWTLTLDLHLEDGRGLVVGAVSHSVEVVRRGQSASYGVFWRGSGVGARARSTVAQGRSLALRIAAQQSIIMLLGRHFRVPYWRVIPGGEPDEKLIADYRSVLANGDAEARGDFRLLLYAHGVEVALDSYEFTEPERRDVVALKERLDLPANTSAVDLAIHLWRTVPYKDSESRIRDLRRELRNQLRAEIEGQQTDFNSFSSKIAQLTDNQELRFPVYFEHGSADLTKAANEKIDQFAEALKASARYDGKDWWIELRGHSDARGEQARNLTLSKDRAERVRAYLERKHSLPHNRFVSSGFGSAEPVNKDAKSEEEHAKNRRVEILLVIGERPGPPQRKTGSVKNTAPNSENLPLFPAEQWPLPRGVVLPSKLAAATLSTVRTAYPTGRYSSRFGYYAISLGQRESDLFSEIAFFFRGEARDPSVWWVEFKCRGDVRQRLLAAMLERFPQGEEKQGDYAEAVTSWVDGEDYKLTLGQGGFCLKIESAAL